MPADKFGRYLISDTYREQVSAAVKKAIRNLEEHGIAPVYVARKPKDAEANAESGDAAKNVTERACQEFCV
ncbi:hypothetical protein [Burkholderia stagnalis]|uniref:hypothetical protein n=1 Tax=Burkholderia stagnalis TaxID=1503054 RepID=UPI00075A1EE4|nr:hypothetical protein [Burkholderia stagnalis]KVM76662.1 hypothetical protein WT05_31010 [Burkholderia stagnalis]